LSSPVTDSQT